MTDRDAFQRPLAAPVGRRALLTGAAVTGVLALTPCAASAASAASAAPGGSRRPPRPTPPGAPLTPGQARQLRRWAAATWTSLAAMTDDRTGLPTDTIEESLAPEDRNGFTSPTNIGGYLWSTVTARDLGIISRGECSRRLRRTLTTLLRMQHHVPSGMFYNWYSEATGDVLTTWPGTTDRVYPFASSIDNGWLGAALLVTKAADPATARLSDQLFRRMRWDMYYDVAAPRPGGLLHGGFWDAPPPEGSTAVVGNHIGIGPDVWYTGNYYDTAVSETRITSYLGILTGQLPARQYFAPWRTFPASDDWNWQEMQPVGRTRTYLGTEVFEGAYTYRGMHIVPGWGGSMFEELMPDVFVPESAWAPHSWGLNHPLHVRAQREHGLLDAGYGYWGFSPCADPFAGYREYGVDALGMNPTGYLSDRESTDYDIGFGSSRPAANPHPGYGDGVVTPHASFLAMMHEPSAAFDNLSGIATDLGAYSTGGFFDAVATRSGTVARRYLALDQSMVVGGIGNVLCRGSLRRYFTADRRVEARLRPVIGQERFGAGIA